MHKLLLKLLTLVEIAIGVTLLFIGITGTFSYFLFNALIGVMGFLVLADGLGRIDNPSDREDDQDRRPSDNQGGHRRDENPNHPIDNNRRPGHFGSGEPDSD